MSEPFRMVAAFPQPPALVRQVLNQLRIARSGNPDTIAEIADLPRPWDPASCPSKLRHHIWLWCDDVVGWLNHDYVWRTVHLIPECWPRHPHIANELPALACQRVLAVEALHPEPLEEWHRYALPSFVERLTVRMGESCRAGKHIDWPAAPRYEVARSESAVVLRQDLFLLDVNPTRLVRPISGSGTGAGVS